VPNLRAWYLAIAGSLPNTVTVDVQETGDVIDDATGTLTGAWSTSPVLPVVGTSAAAYAAPAGWAATWNTTTIVGGKRLKGRTYLVPGAASMYQTDGSIEPVILAALQGYTNTFMAAASGDLVVWHRPVGGVGGSHGLVTSARVNDKVVVLRSRRD
jgi:hypothetical protein